MHFRASKSYTRWVEGLELVLEACCCRRFVKYVSSFLCRHLADGCILKEFPDRMVATFSILPAPKVSAK